MRILIVCSGFEDSSIIAQPWRFFYEVAKELIAKGHDVNVVREKAMASSCSNYVKKSEIRGIPVHTLPTKRTPPLFSPIMSPESLENFVERFSPDIMYWCGEPLSGYYFKKLKKLRVPNVMHISLNLYGQRNLHLSLSERASFNWRFHFMNTPLANPFLHLLNQKAICMITVPNFAIKKGLTDRGVFSNKIQVLPTTYFGDDPFSKEDVKNVERNYEEMRLSAKTFVVAYFGPPSTYRGTDTLLYAMHKLRPKLPDLELLLLLRRKSDEQSPSAKLLQDTKVKLGLGDSIKIVSGVLPTQKLKNFIRLSNIVVLPFKVLLSEPPLSVLETMRWSKPLVTTDISGLPELVGVDRGLLIKPANSTQLAKAIYYLAKHPQVANALARKACDYVLKLPDRSQMCEHITSLFSDQIN